MEQEQKVEEMKENDTENKVSGLDQFILTYILTEDQKTQLHDLKAKILERAKKFNMNINALAEPTPVLYILLESLVF